MYDHFVCGTECNIQETAELLGRFAATVPFSYVSRYRLAGPAHLVCKYIALEIRKLLHQAVNCHQRRHRSLKHVQITI